LFVEFWRRRGSLVHSPLREEVRLGWGSMAQCGFNLVKKRLTFSKKWKKYAC